MRVVSLTAGLGVPVLLAASSLFGQSMSTLPRGAGVKENGTRVYRFSVDYYTSSPTGEVRRKQRISGEYVRGLAAGEVLWRNVEAAESSGLDAPLSPPRKREFMDGFQYKNDLALTFHPDFFRKFPPDAVFERNLVWDTGMIERFGQAYFEELKLNQPFHVIRGGDVTMPGVGTFRNRDVQLEWIGRSRRNGQDCALILYKAFLNPVSIDAGGLSMRARSDYWGEIWVSLRTKQIEYATVHENVTGQVKPPGVDVPSPMSVFRTGVLELLDAGEKGNAPRSPGR